MIMDFSFRMQEEMNLVMPMTLSTSHFSSRSFHRVDTVLDLSPRQDKKSTVPHTCTLSQRTINSDTFPLRHVLSSAVEFVTGLLIVLFPFPSLTCYSEIEVITITMEYYSPQYAKIVSFLSCLHGYTSLLHTASSFPLATECSA